MVKVLLLVACTLFLFPTTGEAQVRVDRLERLASHLEKITPQKFDMDNWGNGVNPDDPNYQGCAAGHATTLFAKEGFRYSPSAHAPTPSLRVPSRGELRGLDAAQEFFGLDGRDALTIFTSTQENRRNPQQVARDIRQVIRISSSAAVVSK